LQRRLVTWERLTPQVEAMSGLRNENERRGPRAMLGCRFPRSRRAFPCQTRREKPHREERVPTRSGYRSCPCHVRAGSPGYQMEVVCWESWRNLAKKGQRSQCRPHIPRRPSRSPSTHGTCGYQPLPSISINFALSGEMILTRQARTCGAT
jgi:hypothetical protein